MQLLGLDIGYGFVKVTDGEYGYVFPSVVGTGHTKSVYRTIDQVERINNLRVIINGHVYFVGKAALRHSKFAVRNLSETRVQDDDFKVLFLTALTFFCQNREGEFKIVTGLPPGRMHHADELVNRYKRDYSISFYSRNGLQEVLIRIADLEIVPQPLGTYWSQALDLRGRDKGHLRGRIGIIDIGFRTTDLAAVEDGEFIPSNSYTIPVGMADTYNEIGDQIASDYGLERESLGLDEAVIKGVINVAGRPVDITGICNEAFQRLANKILPEVMSKWRVLEYDRVLVSGGGGQSLKSYILGQLPQAELVGNPGTANSRGYLSWANRLWLDTETKPLAGSEVN